MMDLIARFILRISALFEPPASQDALRPIPVPVRKTPTRPGAPR